MGEIDLDARVGPQSLEDDVATLAPRGFFLRQLARLDEALHQGLVPGELHRLPVADQVRAAVADLGQEAVIGQHSHGGGRGSHPADFGVRRGVRVDVFVRNLHRFLQAEGEPLGRDLPLGPPGPNHLLVDRVGRHLARELAGEMATDTIYQQMVRAWGTEREVTAQRFAFRLKEAVEVANEHIHAYAATHPEVRGMGTTTTAVGVLADHCFLTQVGDSRAYLIRNGQAVQLTRDQSLMQRLVEAGELTEEEAARSERRNIILQALGPDARVKVDLTHQEVRRGDILVLCSDGLSGQVKKDEIADIVLRERDLQSACDKLIALANERGGPDNITVVLARFDGEGLRPPEPNGQMGYQVYPLIDTETSTEPVPVYTGSRPPVPARRGRWRVIVLLVAAAAAAALYLTTRSP